MAQIKIKAHDGGEFSAYIATPDVTPAPVLIMIQEIFGVNQEMRNKCEHMADQGFIAVCPDLFWRIEPGIQLVDSVQEELERAFHLFSIFDVNEGIADLKSTLETMRGYEKGAGPVGSIGYCLGGKLAYMLAAESNIDASVCYYGVGIETMLEQAEKIKKPILLHIAGEDEFVPKDAQKRIEDTLAEHDYAQTFHYPGMDHAFARGQGLHYNEEAARLADERTLAFLNDTLRQAQAA